VHLKKKIMTFQRSSDKKWVYADPYAIIILKEKHAGEDNRL
jgi:hypothetical protein